VLLPILDTQRKEIDGFLAWGSNDCGDKNDGVAIPDDDGPVRLPIRPFRWIAFAANSKL
jgi:hypothetical protein